MQLATNQSLLDNLVRFAQARRASRKSGRPRGPPHDVYRPLLLWTLLLLPFARCVLCVAAAAQEEMRWRLPTWRWCDKAATRRSTWKRHVPPCADAGRAWAHAGGAARPVAVVHLPSNKQTIMLAMDVSGSMRATDVEPSRIVAAQNAAKAFLNDLPRHVRVGIVAFAGTAQLAQLPTLSREDLVTAIDRFQLQRGTATGNGIVLSLATLFPDDGIDIGQMQWGRSGAFGKARSIDDAGEDKDRKDRDPVAPGSYTSAAIIMLTDGQRTTGVDPMEAAKMAADRGVRVYTVGIGTVNGETIGFEGWSMRVRLDEDTLGRRSPTVPPQSTSTPARQRI